MEAGQMGEARSAAEPAAAPTETAVPKGGGTRAGSSGVPAGVGRPAAPAGGWEEGRRCTSHSRRSRYCSRGPGLPCDEARKKLALCHGAVLRGTGDAPQHFWTPPLKFSPLHCPSASTQSGAYAVGAAASSKAKTRPDVATTLRSTPISTQPLAPAAAGQRQALKVTSVVTVSRQRGPTFGQDFVKLFLPLCFGSAVLSKFWLTLFFVRSDR